MRLIDADAVLAALGIFHRHDNDNDNARHFMNGIETAVEIIEDAPDVEAVPLKPLAKWLAGYAVAPSLHLQMVCHVEPRGNVHDANAECWERLLRRMSWEGADE